MTLTPALKAQLKALRDFGAVSLETALGPYDGRKCEPTLTSRLASMGLVESKTIRPLGSQRTVHWLTPTGQTAAAALQEF
tara:strand:- start:120 stop:359 length:240 start_codon:yes stop_codon:yes gene_type:complete